MNWRCQSLWISTVFLISLHRSYTVFLTKNELNFMLWKFVRQRLRMLKATWPIRFRQLFRSLFLQTLPWRHKLEEISEKISKQLWFQLHSCSLQLYNLLVYRFLKTPYTKNYWNRFTFDRVILKTKRWQFFETWCIFNAQHQLHQLLADVCA